MAVEFATDEWIKALKDELNNSKSYHDAAKTWEGDFYFVVRAGDAIYSAGNCAARMEELISQLGWCQIAALVLPRQGFVSFAKLE